MNKPHASKTAGIASLIPSPAAGYEQPFEMLEACHERVHRMLGLLERLREHIAKSGIDQQARDAARDVMRYFDQAAPEHHRDEELHVFPPLLAQGDPKVVPIVVRLQQDHLQMEQQWERARRVLESIRDGKVHSLAPAGAATLEAFAGLYGEHIRAEEEIAYPAATPLIDEAKLAAMGEEMMRRRGVK